MAAFKTSSLFCYRNADCKVLVDDEEFNCHLIVLQCYSEVLDAHIGVKKVQLPAVSTITLHLQL